MTEIDLPVTPAAVSAEALFRYRVVAEVLARVALGVSHATAIEDATAEVYVVVDVGAARTRSISRRTLYRWLARFELGGVAALEPAPRARRPSLAVPDKLVAFLRAEKTRDPAASVPELLRRADARGELGVEAPHRATVHRVLSALDVPLTRTSTKRDADVRRFAYPHRMRMMLVDGKHFRAGGARLRRVAFFFLDDCARRVLGVAVGTSESALLLLRGLFEVLCRYGLMDILYLDRGPGFIADDTHAVCLRLGVRVILGKRRYPEGHGKIERFNRTAWNDCLRGLRDPAVDPECSALELRLRHYIDTQYNVRPHEALSGKSPRERFDADERELRFARSQGELRERFFVTETRKVSADNVLSLDGVDYEVARGHARTRIVVYRHTLDGHLAILHDGRLVRLHPVDLAHNAERPRGAARSRDSVDDGEAPTTAAALAFDRDFGPVTDPDGGLTRPTSRTQE
jgi:transposase InsO family protein